MPERSFQINDLIENRYRVLAVFRTGGMGTLYRVADEGREGTVLALKTVRVNVLEEAQASMEQFRDEFRILTKFRHPNLVSVYDFGISAGEALYFTMEWIEGHNLEPHRHPMEPAVTIPIIIQICRALAYLHARGAIHGDLKPANVLMQEDRVKIVDFGVAIESRSSKPRTPFYTMGYSAPEIAQQEPLDHRLDLYSLGATWYALLVGEPPLFISGTEWPIRFTLTELLQNQNQVPLSIIDVIVRLLARDPINRYAGANEVIAAINKATGSRHELETRATAGSYALRGRFVGREAEMCLLQEQWEAVRQKENRIVLIGGESGVGKTRLLEEFIIQAELQGIRVVRGQCVEQGGMAYRPWREILRIVIRYVEDVHEERLRSLGPVLAMLLPQLWQREYMQGLEPPTESDPQVAQQRLNHSIIQLLHMAAEPHPLILALEDMHWADEASLGLLGLLAQISGPAGLMTCLTYRPDELDPGHSLETLESACIRRIALERLTPALTHDLVHSMLGLEALPVALIGRLQQITGGNAFFVQELVRSLAEDGLVLQRTIAGWRVDERILQSARLPDTIHQVVGRRLGHLSPEARQVLRWAAVVGPVFWDGIVAEISQISGEHVAAVLNEALTRELIRERPISAIEGQREFLFAKPAVREASYESIPPTELREAHERAALWLAFRREDQIGEHLGLIGDHFEKAGQIEQAARYFGRAGRQAAERFANTQALDYLNRVLHSMPDIDPENRYQLLLVREEVYNRQGAREAQSRDIADLRKLADLLADDRYHIRVALRQAAYSLSVGNYPAAKAAAQTAARLAQKHQDRAGEAEACLQLSGFFRYQGDRESALAQSEQALLLAREAGIRKLEADSLRLHAYLAGEQGDFAAAKEIYEQCLPIYREINDRRSEGRCLNGLGEVARLLGDYDRAGDYYGQALALFQEIGDRWGEDTVMGNLSLVAMCLGDFAQAKSCCEPVLVMARKTGNRRELGYALTNLGHALKGLNQLEEAARSFQEALAVRRELSESHLAMESLAGWAGVLLAQGHFAQARMRVEEILSYLETGTLNGTEEPFKVFLTCYRILQANQDSRAQSILRTAYYLLQEMSFKISVEPVRRLFLEQVPEHREIVKVFSEESANKN